MSGSTVVLFAFFLFALAHAGTVSYPSYPLAVKSPYIQAWLFGDDATSVPHAQAQFWTGATALGWNVMARVTATGSNVSTTYTLFGFPTNPAGTVPANQSGPIDFTATHTTIPFDVGTAQFELDFFSAIEPTDYLFHSLPYSYLTVSATPKSASSIQIFSSIDDTWTGQSGNIAASFNTYENTTFYSLFNPNQRVFSQNNEQASWGSTVYATQSSLSSNLSSNCGASASLYSSFVSTGNLGKSASTCAIGNILAFSQSFAGGRSTASTTFAVGIDRSQAVSLHGQTQSGYYRSQFTTVGPAVDHFLSSYSTALTQSKSLDQLIRSKGESISSNYADILDASVRQTYGALEITIPYSTLSTDASTTNIFLKEISSDGNVNSLDVIYPSFPLLYLISPGWIAGLLHPVLQYLEQPPPTWPLNFVPHDIGQNYPLATGYDTGEANDNPQDNVPEYMPLESTSALIIMLAAYAQATKDTTYAKQYYGAAGKYKLTTYADYLATNGLYPAVQLATVDAIRPATANQTQLAIIATIALGAAGQLTGFKNYTRLSQKFANSILHDTTLGAFPGGSHLTYNYNEPDTWSVVFPLFTDALLGLNLFESAYNAQSSWYAKHFETYGLPYGQPSNSAQLSFGVTDWNFWGAATSSAAVRAQVIDTTHKFLTDGLNTPPFGTKYNVTDGLWIQNRARPTVGANFALLLVDAL